MNQQQHFSQELKKEHRKGRTYISFPENHMFEPYLNTGSQMRRQYSDNNDTLKQKHSPKTANNDEEHKQRKKEEKSGEANKIKFRDSTPLLFSPPRLEDRQIINSHGDKCLIQDKDGFFDESNEQLPGTLSEAAQIEVPEAVNEKEDRSVQKKTIVIEFFNGKTDPQNPWFFNESLLEENHWHNSEEDDVPIFDAESTVSAMREFVKEQLSSLVESASLTEEYQDLNHTESCERSTEEIVNALATESPEERSGFFVQEYEEKTATLPEESTGLKVETLVEEADEWHEETIFQEEVSEEKETGWWKDGLGNCSSKTIPSVKLPVLLAVLNVDIDIFETFDLPVPVKQIMKSDWEVHSISLQVLLPSAKVLIKGILTADINYLQDYETASLYQHKINIPWRKVMEINWLYTPEISSSQLNEYMFHDRNHLDVQTHYESIKNFSDTIYFDVKQQHSVWTHEFFFKNQAWMVEFQGTITLVCQLLQSQLVNL